jgi:hypothetical protein
MKDKIWFLLGCAIYSYVSTLLLILLLVIAAKALGWL